MPTVEEISRAKRELHKQLDQLNSRKARNLAESFTKFRKWASGILQNIGLMTVLETLGNALWNAFKAYLGF